MDPTDGTILSFGWLREPVPSASRRLAQPELDQAAREYLQALWPHFGSWRLFHVVMSDDIYTANCDPIIAGVISTERAVLSIDRRDGALTLAIAGRRLTYAPFDPRTAISSEAALLQAWQAYARFRPYRVAELDIVELVYGHPYFGPDIPNEFLPEHLDSIRAGRAFPMYRVVVANGASDKSRQHIWVDAKSGRVLSILQLDGIGVSATNTWTLPDELIALVRVGSQTREVRL